MAQAKSISLLIMLFISLLFICSPAHAYAKGELEQPWKKQVREMEENKGNKRADQSNDKQSTQKISNKSDSDDEDIDHDDTRDQSF